VSVDQGMATVWLGDGGILRSGTAQQALGIAQFVYTATEIPGVERVRFRVGGQPAEVPRGDGTLSSRAVDRSDYPSVAP
jgi:spore germination protein GerM